MISLHVSGQQKTAPQPFNFTCYWDMNEKFHVLIPDPPLNFFQKIFMNLGRLIFNPLKMELPSGALSKFLVINYQTAVYEE
jgi:hypothetical protein